MSNTYIKRELLKNGFKCSPPLDNNFQPAILWQRAFVEKAEKSSESIPVSIAIEKGKNSRMVYNTRLFSDESDLSNLNYQYIELIIKTLLWVYGGYKVIIAGSGNIYEHVKNIYSKNGKRSFDAGFMSSIYERPFEVVSVDTGRMPSTGDKSIELGGHLDGCRIGFDLGASDRKVSAVIDGRAVFSEEVIWNPGSQKNPEYHYHEIMSMLHHAAAHMPRVDAIGGSSAGIYINNRVMNASLFRGIPEDLFNKKVKNIFLDIQNKWGVPLKVINDGEVTALAGSMSLKKNAVLGIAMGSSEAGGYINKKGNINGWLNELAFIPVDLNSDAPVDEWSGDRGCGVQYFSQLAAVRLAEKAGVKLDNGNTPAEKLKIIQEMVTGGDERAKKIFETIGCDLGYSIAYYSQFYEIETVLILGRVTSGEGGQIILQNAKKVLGKEFPGLADKITINLPDESSRRVGQSIAAASLPLINGKKVILR
jgi:predicted NBD/HSP70 family sugar kinase